MTPGARLLSAIEILDRLAADARPADRFMREWFRNRRYIGSKDRRAITRRVYEILRSRARLDWWCSRRLVDRDPDNRLRVIAFLVLSDRLDENDITQFFDGGTYRPPQLSSTERTLIAALDGHMLDSSAQPDCVRGEYPDWLNEALRRRFDGAVVDELQALNREAAVDIRINTLVPGHENVPKELRDAGIETEPLLLSPIGLRLKNQPDLQATSVYREGLIEIQDEGSQIVALMTDARPGHLVVDYCAGAGGKTLAFAATMKTEGRLVAFDADERRLRKMRARLSRSGCQDFVECRSGAPSALGDLEGKADRVLTDVPCSTSGAWRRDPAAKWRLTRADVNRFTKVQRSILSNAARLVRPGGRLIYATCSVLDEENEVAANWFLENHQEFRLLPVGDVWNDVLLGRPFAFSDHLLRLSPAKNGTDGFFLAIFERQVDHVH